MKILPAVILFFCTSLSVAQDSFTIYRPDKAVVFIRSHWDKQTDHILRCSIGTNNKQFNFHSAYLVPKTFKTESLKYSRNLPPKFHECSDSPGVIKLYPDPKKDTLYILSGNHGYHGSTITMPGHNFTGKDIGKKFKGKYWIVKINSKDKFSVLPSIRKKDVPEAKNIQPLRNFRSLRIFKQKYLLDGKEIKPGTIARGKSFTVEEKSAVCKFDVLAANGFKHDKVNDFYAIHEIDYNFFPNMSCRVDTRITFPGDVRLRSASTVQDSDLYLTGFDFYEKYIPKVKPIQESAKTDWRKAQAFYRPQKKFIPDSRRYDFAAVQDLTEIRKLNGPAATRFQIGLRGGCVDPNDQPDRWIEFVGKNENGKRVRKIGNVLGLDTEFGFFRKSERAKNISAFVIPNWHKTYPTQYARGNNTIKAGTVLEAVGYRCYFNPEKIGDATVLFAIPVKDGKKIYADFHKSVKDYILPFAENAQTVIMESSPGVSLKGNKVSVSGKYGYIVVKVK